MTGLYPTSTTIAESGSVGDYSVTATVVGNGTQAFSPTGTVSFLDTSNGNSVLGTAPLGQRTAALSFASGPTLPFNAFTAVLADFNGDGLLDVAAIISGGTDSNPSPIGVLLATKQGTYVQTPSLPASPSLNWQGLLSADFNGDGKADLLAWTSSATFPFQIFLSNGDGTFTALPNTATTDSSVSQAVVGDFNNDGIEDIAVATQTEVTVLLGNGDGTFSREITTSVPVDSTIRVPPYLVAADFNGDGKLDLTVDCLTFGNNSNPPFPYPTTYTFLGNGDGTFNVILSTGNAYYTIDAVAAVADFNGDGILDVLATGLTAPYTEGNFTEPSQVMLGKGDGTFVSGNIPLLVKAAGQDAVDINGDGNVDLIGFAENSQYVSAVAVYLGNGDGSFQSNPIILPNGGYDSAVGFAVGDLTGNGLPDIIVLSTDDTPDSVIQLTQLTETATATISGISPPVPGISNLVDASYPGDTHFTGSVSGTVGLSGVPVTSLALSATPAGSGVVGQPITLTATLAPYTAPAGSTNGETVTFKSSTQALGTGTLSGGVANYTFTPSRQTTYTFQAIYGGDTEFSAATSKILSYAVSTAATALSLSANPGTVLPGQSTILTATLTPYTVAGQSSDGEEVSFYQSNPAQLVAMATLSGGAASVTIQANTIAAVGFYAAYAGDDALAASTSNTVSVTEEGAPSISFAVANQTYGAALFAVGATSNSAEALTYSVVSGPATISGSTVTITGAGAVVLKVSQAAASPYLAGSQTATFGVAPAALAVSANHATRLYGTANPAFSATVAGAVYGDTFTETFSTTATASSGVGSYTIVPAAAGNKLADYTVTLTNGLLTVVQAGTATTVALSNGNQTLTATVAPATSGVPTGTVNFYEGQTVVGSSALVNGVATYVASAPVSGDASISAEYGGDVNFTGSESASAPVLSGAVAQSSLTVASSASATDLLTLTAAAGYTGTVQFACGGLPANTVCTFQPASLSFSAGSGSGSTTVTIQTSSVQAELLPFGSRFGDGRGGLLAFGLCLPGMMFALSARGRRKLRGRLGGGVRSLVLLACLGLFVTACGTGTGGDGGSSITPPGTYGVSLVTTGANGLSQMTSISLTVQ